MLRQLQQQGYSHIHISFNLKRIIQLLSLVLLIWFLVFLKNSIAYADPAPGSVVFYEANNFAGTAHTYKKGDKIDLLKSDHDLNDHLKSVKIGDNNTKVLAWQDDGFHGAFEEYREDNPQIGIGLSSFHVVSNDLSPSFKLVDQTASRHSLTLQSYEYAQVIDYSKDEKDDFQVVGTLDKTQPNLGLTTAVFLRNETTGEYAPPGSVYFKYNDDKTEAIISESDLPKGLTYESQGNDKFIFIWNGDL